MAEHKDDPVLRPWVVKALRRRPKLLDLETRDRFLAQIEQNMAERRRPAEISARLSRMGFESAAQAMEPAVQEAARSKMEDANRSILRRL